MHKDGAVKITNVEDHINRYRKGRDILHLGSMSCKTFGTQILSGTVYLLFKDTYRKVTFTNDAYHL